MRDKIRKREKNSKKKIDKMKKNTVFDKSTNEKKTLHSQDKTFKRGMFVAEFSFSVDSTNPLDCSICLYSSIN